MDPEKAFTLVALYLHDRTFDYAEKFIADAPFFTASRPTEWEG
jgi:hypothetical protein